VGGAERPAEPGEEVLFRARLHPVALAGTLGFAAFVVGVTALIVLRNELPAATVVRLWTVAALVVVAASLPPFLRWRTTELAVTSRRVVAGVRVLRRRTVEVPLRDLEAVAVDQTLGGRLLGYGTVHLLGRGGTVESFPRVAAAERLREAILRQVPSRAARAGR
jgi:hypothetical protein